MEETRRVSFQGNFRAFHRVDGEEETQGRAWFYPRIKIREPTQEPVDSRHAAAERSTSSSATSRLRSSSLRNRTQDFPQLTFPSRPAFSSAS